MRKQLILPALLILAVCTMVPLGCSGSNSPTASAVGSWSASDGVDGSGVAISVSSPYRLNLNQTGQVLAGEFILPREQGGTIYTVTGTEIAGRVQLVTTGLQEILSLSGQLTDNDILELMLEEADGQIIHLLCFRDKQPAPVQLFNKTSFGKRCGGPTSPVILIHGMDNDITIWNEMIERFKTDGTCDRHAVWVYGYDWLKHIDLNGYYLFYMIDFLYDCFPETYPELSEPPIIIAHSMGGLVSRSYVAQGYPLAGLITLGTPHQGSPLADFTYIFPWALGTGVADLRPDSDFLLQLNGNSHETTQRSKYVLINGSVSSTWVCTRKLGKYCVLGHWEWSGDYSAEVKAGYSVMEKPNDGMVPETSARFETDNHVTRVNTFAGIDHMSLNQPSRSEEIYKYIRDYLQNH